MTMNRIMMMMIILKHLDVGSPVHPAGQAQAAASPWAIGLQCASIPQGPLWRQGLAGGGGGG